MRNALWVGVLFALVVGSPALAAELVLDYPESSIHGDRVELTLTSDVPLEEATVNVQFGGVELPYRMTAVDPYTYSVRLVPLVPKPGPFHFYVTAVTDQGKTVTLPAGAPHATIEIAILEDTIAPDFVYLNPDQAIVAGQRAALAFLVPAAFGKVNPATVEVLIDGLPAEEVLAEPDLIFAWYTFQRPGQYTIEVRGADLWGNVGTRTFAVLVTQPRAIDTRFTLRTDASAVFGQSPMELATRLDGFVRAGSLTVNGYFSQPLSGINPVQRYSLQAEWNPAFPVRLKGSLGAFSARGTSLVVNTGIEQGFGVEGELWALSGGYHTGIISRASGTAAEIISGSGKYERNMASLSSRVALGKVFDVGISGAIVSDKYLEFCTPDADGCTLPKKARANAAAGVEAGLNLFGLSWVTEAAVSLDMPRIQRAVPYSGGSIILGSDDAEETTRVTPSDLFSEEVYARFPIPQFTLTELMDTANPAVLPGVAFRSRATLPRIFGASVQAEYAFADSGFDSLVAPGPSGEEKLSARITFGGGRSWQVTLRASDSREVKTNLLLDALLEMAADALDTETSDSGGGGPRPLERTQEVSIAVRIPTSRMTIRPSIAYEVNGEQFFSTSDSLWSKGPGRPISADERISHKAKYGVRFENIQVQGIRVGAGLTLTNGAAYEGGKVKEPVSGSSVDLEAQRGAYYARVALDYDPLADQRNNRLRVSWSASSLSVGLGWEQLISAGEQTESRVELGVSTYHSVGVNAFLGAGLNYAIIDTGGEKKPVGSVFVYHQMSF